MCVLHNSADDRVDDRLVMNSGTTVQAAHATREILPTRI